MVKLFCALVGVKGSAFPVDIEMNQSVGDLKDAIKGKKENDLKTVDADKLELYLAKKGDTWLQSSSEDVKKLKKGEKSATIEELMHEDHELDGEFGIDDILEGLPTPTKKQIHVLVVIPESATSEATAEEKPLTLKMLQEFMDQRDKKKRKCIAFSSMSSSSANKLIKSLPVVIVNGKEPGVSNKNTIPPFQWDESRDEDKQVAQYSTYLERYLSDLLQEKGLCLVDATIHPHLLDVSDDRFDFDLSGTADVLVLQDLGEETIRNLHHCCGLRLVIELKKDMSKEYGKKESQAIAELIAANLKVPHLSPIVLLTDLRLQWVFMWLSEDSQIGKLILKQPTNAFAFIRSILSLDDDSLKIPTPFAQSKRIPMRGNIDKLFPPGDSGIGEMIERCRSIGGESFFDWSMEREIGRKFVQEMPAYASMFREKPIDSPMSDACALMYS